MRLIHVKELKLYEFFDEEIPEYATLSHRWRKEEVSYEDFLLQRGDVLNGQSKGYGWEKIVKACGIAQQDGLEWVWVDTCCIDKKSSAELSEAINCMYKWYSDSVYCYVFLPDVSPVPPSAKKDKRIEERRTAKGGVYAPGWSRGSTPRQHFDSAEFERSEWFTRSWTLQELLAPYEVHFFNNAYGCIGARSGLADVISEATGIPASYLDRKEECSIHHASVAERMRWASRRQATRKEDIAYSLLGLFDVNIPLLYGEGERAFQRLQMEIIRTSDDESIFVWTRQEHPGAAMPPRDFGGCLAPNVNCFLHTIHEQILFPRQHYEVTNKGVRIMVPIVPKVLLEQGFPFRMIVPLNCSVHDTGYDDLRLSVICLQVRFDENLSLVDPGTSARYLYLHGAVEDCESIKFPECLPSAVPQAIEDFLRARGRHELLARHDVKHREDVPVYLQI